MIAQFEITTRCNFECFYCAGRHMRQGDMPFDAFQRLLDRHIQRYGTPETVSLQGEGEPTLHPQFFEMAERARALRSEPYTITNGSYRRPERFIGLFTRVGVSIDSLDESAAKAIGRYNLHRVIEFVDALAPHLRIVIHSVAHKEHTPRIAAWCRQRGLDHLVQPLQAKSDYRRHYLTGPAPAPAGRFSCAFLARPMMRFYSLEGIELPCCYIKDTAGLQGIDELLQHQADGVWPQHCAGCRFGSPAAVALP